MNERVVNTNGHGGTKEGVVANAASATETFEQHRAALQALAYRLLGSVSDAQDIVQDAYLRWMSADIAKVTAPRAFLTRITTRLCLDHLKSARVRRETYVGPWLPEPMVHAAGFTATPEDANLAQDISYALMLALERLSPLERAAFLLHDVFALSFPEIAETLQRTPAACRKLAARARENVRAARPRFTVPAADTERIAEIFIHAAQSGDLDALRSVLATDAVLHSDGGGKVLAVLRPILGADRIGRLFAGLARRGWGPRNYAAARINGLPGYILRDASGVTTDTMAFEIREGRIQEIYIVRNPEKLRHLGTK